MLTGRRETLELTRLRSLGVPDEHDKLILPDHLVDGVLEVGEAGQHGRECGFLEAVDVLPGETAAVVHEIGAQDLIEYGEIGAVESILIPATSRGFVLVFTG